MPTIRARRVRPKLSCPARRGIQYAVAPVICATTAAGVLDSPGRSQAMTTEGCRAKLFLDRKRQAGMVDSRLINL